MFYSNYTVKAQLRIFVLIYIEIYLYIQNYYSFMSCYKIQLQLWIYIEWSNENSSLLCIAEHRWLSIHSVPFLLDRYICKFLGLFILTFKRQILCSKFSHNYGFMNASFPLLSEPVFISYLKFTSVIYSF